MKLTLNRSHKLLLVSAAMTALLLVGGCGTNSSHKVEGGKPSPAWKAQEAYLSSLSAWEMSGRAGSGLGFSGQLDWLQHTTQSFIKMRGPLGIGRLEITGNAEQVVLKDKHGTRTVDNPEEVLLDNYGMPLPIDYLRWWMLGIAAPNEDAGYQFDGNGNAVAIQQAGWLVSLSDYQPYVCNVILASKLTLLNDDHKLKVVLKKWAPLEGQCPSKNTGSPSSALSF